MIKSFLKEHPWHKQSDIKRLCKIFKAQSNGTDIWPKLPTMVKLAIEKFKINQQIELLGLRSGQAYKDFFDKLIHKKGATTTEKSLVEIT